jgi:hypothetical protein
MTTADTPLRGLIAAAGLALLLLPGAGGAGEPAGRGGDPLGREIERWTRFVRENPATDEIWKQVKAGSGPALQQASRALREGRPLLALLRFAAVHENLAAAVYLGGRPAAQRTDPAAFEAEWKRMAKIVPGNLSPAGAGGSQPTAIRAIREVALPQARIYYEASLDYGRNTMLENGLFYLGAAKAWSDFERFAGEIGGQAALGRSAGPQAPGAQPAAAPPLRGLGPELDRLEDEMLAAYRPPASIDGHRDFIKASSSLKEARELDAAGLHFGALLRYLQAALEFAPLRPAPRSPREKSAGDPAVAARLRALEERLSASEVDHSLGRLFLEMAHADLEEPSTESGPIMAAAIADDILPRYLAALEPERPRAPRPEPRVTVTLVRWPYT